MLIFISLRSENIERKLSMESFIMCVCYPNTLCKCVGILCDGLHIHLPRPCVWGCNCLNLHCFVGQREMRGKMKSGPFSVQTHGDTIIQNGTASGNC